jgi:hypothetical protein
MNPKIRALLEDVAMLGECEDIYKHLAHFRIIVRAERLLADSELRVPGGGTIAGAMAAARQGRRS